MRRFSLIFIFAVLLPIAADAAMPRPAAFVNDFAGAMDESARQNLDAFLTSFEKQTGVEVAVAVVPSLDGMAVEDYAVRMFQEWGVGKKGKDDGVLFVVAPNERKVRFEVGYGLEGTVNDALAGRILDEYVLPKFKAGDMGGGISAGTVALVETIVKKENLNFDPGKEIAGFESISQKEDEGGPLSTLFKVLVLVFLIYMFIRHPWLFLFFMSGGGRGGRGGSGFSGGFGGFGGGMSGGGGASRSW
jgi:uncharacterized protein